MNYEDWEHIEYWFITSWSFCSLARLKAIQHYCSHICLIYIRVPIIQACGSVHFNGRFPKCWWLECIFVAHIGYMCVSRCVRHAIGTSVSRNCCSRVKDAHCVYRNNHPPALDLDNSVSLLLHRLIIDNPVKIVTTLLTCHDYAIMLLICCSYAVWFNVFISAGVANRMWCGWSRFH